MSIVRMLLAAGMVFHVASTEAVASSACAPIDGGRYDVARVIDGQTLLLEGGFEARLIGAMSPSADAPADRASSGYTDETQALEALVRDRSVLLRYEGQERDRYGRALAQVYVGNPEAGDEIWVQERLIAEGAARAYTLPGNTACIGLLIAAERNARSKRLGLWGRERFRIRSSTDIDGLVRLTGRFVIVEGRVAHVARTQRTTYINFGDNWRKDFTASLANSVLDEAGAKADTFSSLAGKHVRVRGWIERRNGPMINLNSAEEIEVLERAPNQ